MKTLASIFILVSFASVTGTGASAPVPAAPVTACNGLDDLYCRERLEAQRLDEEWSRIDKALHAGVTSGCSLVHMNLYTRADQLSQATFKAWLQYYGRWLIVVRGELLQFKESASRQRRAERELSSLVAESETRGNSLRLRQGDFQTGTQREGTHLDEVLASIDSQKAKLLQAVNNAQAAQEAANTGVDETRQLLERIEATIQTLDKERPNWSNHYRKLLAAEQKRCSNIRKAMFGTLANQ